MNRKKYRTIQEFSIILLFIVIIGLFGYTNFQFTKSSPGGNDFLVHWVGTQKFVLEGVSPYSDKVALEIQRLVYGRPALEGEHELRVAYPFYSILLFLPFSLIRNFEIARAFWMTFLELLLMFSTIIAIKLVKWKIKPLFTFLIIAFSLFWYHGLRSIINGNAVVVILFLVIVCIYAISRKQDELAGISLALSTIKPQVAFAFIIFVIIWAIVNNKQKILFWFFGTLISIVLLGLFLLPTWPLEFLREVMRYPGYNPPGTPATALAELMPGAGYRLGLLISAISGLVLLAEWFFGRHSEELKFFWLASLTLVLGQWINIQTDPGNFLIMFPACIIIFRMLDDRWRKNGLWIIMGYLLVVFFVPWLFFIKTLDFGYQPVQSPIMFFPTPVLLLVGLYWVRWWVKNPAINIINS